MKRHAVRAAALALIALFAQATSLAAPTVSAEKVLEAPPSAATQGQAKSAAAGLSGDRRYQLLFGADLDVIGALKMAPDLSLSLKFANDVLPVPLNAVPIDADIQMHASVGYISAGEISQLDIAMNEQPFDVFYAGDSFVRPTNFNSAWLGGPHSVALRVTDTDNSMGVYRSAPLNLTFVEPNILGAITGVTFSNGTRYIEGWTCAAGVPQQTRLDLHFGGSGDSGYYMSATANQAVHSVPAQACGATGLAHGFKIPVDTTMARSHAGSPVRVFGRIKMGSSHKLLLAGSGSQVVNNRPTVSFNPASAVRERTAITLSASASDPDGQWGDSVVSLRLFKGTLSGAGIDFLSASHSWTPTAQEVGTSVTWIVQATDVMGATTEVYRSIVVQANAKPTLAQISPTAQSTTIQSGSSITLSGVAGDAEGQLREIRIFDDFTGQTTSIAASGASQSFSHTINNITQSRNFSIQAIDDLGDSSTAVTRTASIHVEPDPAEPAALSPASGGDPISDRVGATDGSFRVDESGAATYSIPLFAVPGSAGVAPEMSLNYSSRAGDGPVGMGWSIGGVSSISRCRRTAEAGDGADAPPIQLNDADEFCLDGQRLLKLSSDTPACPTHAGFTVDQYRTEVESFQRVCAYRRTSATLNTGPRYFTVERKDGTLSWFGDRRLASNVEDGGITHGYMSAAQSLALPAIYLWAQTRTQDSVGNYIDFTYSKNPAGSERQGEHLLLSVNYTGLIQPAQATFASIEFAYEDAPVEKVRYLLGHKLWSTKRLASVSSKSGAELVRYYKLSYENVSTTPNFATRVSRLHTVQECSHSDMTVCLNPTTFTWTASQQSPGALVSVDTLSNGSSSRNGATKFGDIDGDGRADLVWTKNDGPNSCQTDTIFVAFSRLSNGRPTFKQHDASICLPAELPDNHWEGWFLLDYDGDGRDDLFTRGLRNGAATWVAHASQSSDNMANSLTPFNMGSDLLGTLANPLPAHDDDSTQPQLADINGDGLLDVVYARYVNVSAKIATLHARLMERQAGGAFAWGAERSVDLFADGRGICPAGSTCTTEIKGFYRQGNYQHLVDFDGDARSDLLAKIKVTMQNCGVGGPGPGDPQPPRTIENYPNTEYSSGGDNSQNANSSSCSATYIVPSVIDYVETGSSGAVKTSFYGTAWHADAYESVNFADINGDGLSDMVYQEISYNTVNDGTVGYFINNGLGISTHRVLTDGTQWASLGSPQLQVIDINGDGAADLVHPNKDNFNQYLVRFATTSRLSATVASDVDAPAFAPPQPIPNLQSGCSSVQCSKAMMFGDYDADGVLDVIRIDWSSGTTSVWSALSNAPGEPRDAVSRITNGLGAKTEVTYKPMTNKSVYRRGSGGRALQYGRRSPVQDFVAPMYLVAKASSSAPLASNANAVATVHYRYEGGRTQAGGRGFLGFEKIHSIDVNHSNEFVVSTTQYLQAFPFIGVPWKTTVQRVSGGFAADGDNCDTGNSDTCYLQKGNAFAEFTGAKLISESTSTWESSPVFAVGGTQRPYHPRLGSTQEKRYDAYATGPQQVQSQIDTSYAYTPAAGQSDWGHPTTVTVNHYDTDGSSLALVKTTTTTNAYAHDNPSRWWLGRLSSSTVTHARPDESNVVRTTTFAYNTTHGQLQSETVSAGGGGARNTLSTYYSFDSRGNRSHTYTCNSEVTEADCRATTAATLSFKPSSQTRIQRYSRQTFDSLGRFLNSNVELFAWGTAAQEVTTSSVLSRDRFGNPTRVSALNGHDSTAIFGALGRPYASWSETVAGAALNSAEHGVFSITTYRYCGNQVDQVSCPSGAVFRQQVERSAAPTQWQYFDALGRAVLSVTQAFDDNAAGKQLVASCSQYDLLGRTERVSEPFFLADAAGAPSNLLSACSSPTWNSTTYDALNRVVTTSRPGDAAGTMESAINAYMGLAVYQTNPRGYIRKEVRNGLGELVSATDFAAATDSTAAIAALDGGEVFTTSYWYDATGNLRLVRRDAGRGEIDTSMSYDALGRKTGQTDPDAGSSSYEYNALGEVTKSTGADGAYTESFYDARGRVYQKRSKSAANALELTHTYTWDTASNGLGQLAREESSGSYLPWQADTTLRQQFARDYRYEELGRAEGSTTWIDGVSYATETRYDRYGRAHKSQDASGRWSKTEFSDRGFGRAVCESSATDSSRLCREASTQVYQRIRQLSARGQVELESRGGARSMDVARAFYSRSGRAYSISAPGIQNETYAWDVAGNLSYRQRSVGSNYREDFDYDASNRLVRAWLSSFNGQAYGAQGAPQTLSLQYDVLGNICRKVSNVGTFDYGYSGRAACGLSGLPGTGTPFSTFRPHAVTTADGGSFAYDSQGNQTSADYAGTARDRYIRYSLDQQAIEIALASQTSPTRRSRFWYGSDGSRYKREELNGKRTLYLGNVEITQAGGSTITKRYIAGVAVQDIVNGTATTKYLFHDHLGSLVAVSSASGSVLERFDFGAFGDRRDSTSLQFSSQEGSATTRGYTGHEMLDGLDVVHMNGRIFDNRLARFLQADPLIQEPNNPQNFNRYSYVLNNPLNATDPSGFARQRQMSSFGRGVLQVFSTVMTVYSGGLSSWFAAVATSYSTGYASGYMATGSGQGGLKGAYTSVANLGVGALGSSLGYAQGSWQAHLFSGVSGGAVSVMSGGKFGHGFASSLAGSYAGDLGLGLPGEMIAGGTISWASGGKFGNGALTASFSYVLRNAARRAYAAPGGDGTSATTLSVDAQKAFAAASSSFGGTFRSEQMAAEAFRDAFLPFTEEHGLEVGGNIALGSKGYFVRDVTLGGKNGVHIPRFDHASAVIHTHPEGVDNRFSGTLRFEDGRLNTGAGYGDYGRMYENRISGYVYRAGDGAGLYFNYSEFSSALSAARAAGTNTYAEWYTRELP